VSSTPNPPFDSAQRETLAPDAIQRPGEEFEELLPQLPHAGGATREDPVWTGWDVVRIAVVAVLAIVLFSMVAISVAVATRGAAKISTDLEKSARVVIPAQAAAYLGVLLFMYSLVTRRYRRQFATAIHWNWPRTRWFVFMIAGVALAIVVQLASSFLPIPKSLPIDLFFIDTTSAWLMTAFGVLLAPMVEELFFRGFLYPVLARRTGVVVAIVLTAAGFAFIHESQLAQAWAPLLMLFVVGLVLTITRAVTGSVAAGVLLHMAYNATLFSLVYVASDGFKHLEKLQ
jgi:membrane protease YdiL (CAAX protease family)